LASRDEIEWHYFPLRLPVTGLLDPRLDHRRLVMMSTAVIPYKVGGLGLTPSEVRLLEIASAQSALYS
jgi:hypothetical protein